MALPDGIELDAQQFGDQLHIGAFLVEPWHAVNLLVDVSTQDLGHAQLFDDGMEALGVGVIAVGDTIDNEVMNIVGSSQAVEIFDFLADPIGFGRIG